MFVFSDPTLLQAVVEARRRGVKVQVMLNPTRRSGEAENEETRKTLTDEDQRRLVEEALQELDFSSLSAGAAGDLN